MRVQIFNFQKFVLYSKHNHIRIFICRCNYHSFFFNFRSTSFALVTSCFAFILLSFCYLLIDVNKFWSGKPFLYAGMNAIIMYAGHSIAYNNFPVRWYLEDHNNTHFMKLIQDMWSTIFWIFVAFILYRKKLFFSI